MSTIKQKFLTTDGSDSGIFYPVVDTNSVYDEYGNNLEHLNKDLAFAYYGVKEPIAPTDQSQFKFSLSDDGKTATITGLSDTNNLVAGSTVCLPYKYIHTDNTYRTVTGLNYNSNSSKSLNIYIPKTIQTYTVPNNWIIKNPPKVENNDTYSTMPTQIGTWIDGTPIWRVAFDHIIYLPEDEEHPFYNTSIAIDGSLNPFLNYAWSTENLANSPEPYDYDIENGGLIRRKDISNNIIIINEQSSLIFNDPQLFPSVSTYIPIYDGAETYIIYTTYSGTYERINLFDNSTAFKGKNYHWIGYVDYIENNIIK